MNIEFQHSLGDIVETQRGDSGKIVAASASAGRTERFFKSYRIEHQDGTLSWVPEYRIARVLAWQ